MLPYNQIVSVPSVVRLRLKVSSGVASGVAHAVLAELAMLAVTGEPGSETATAAWELATDADTEPTEGPPVKEDVPVAGTEVEEGPLEPPDGVEVIWRLDEPDELDGPDELVEEAKGVDPEDAELAGEDPGEDVEANLFGTFNEEEEEEELEKGLEGEDEVREELVREDEVKEVLVIEDEDEVRPAEELELEAEELERVGEVELRTVEEELDDVDEPLRSVFLL